MNRIVHVISPGPLAGAERMVLTGCAALKAAGVDVHIVAISRGGAQQAAVEAFVAAAQAQGLTTSIVVRRRTLDGVAARALAAVVGDGIVHAHGGVALLHAVAAVPRSRVVATAHGFTSHTRRVRIAEWVEVQLFKRAAMTFAVSAPMAEVLLTRGVKPERVRRVDNCVPEVTVLPNSIAASPRIACVGRLSHEKGVDVLIAALARLPDAQRPSCTIVGDGPSRAALEAQVLGAGLMSHVSFTGWLSDPSEVLSQCDAVVLPSRTEGLPLTLLEAACRGLPVVATAVGGVPSAFAHGIVGACVDKEQPQALAAAINELMQQRTAYRARAHEAAPILKQHFGAKRWGQETLAAYHHLLEQHYGLARVWRRLGRSSLHNAAPHPQPARE